MRQRTLIAKILVMLSLLLLIPVSGSALYSTQRIQRNAEEEIGEFNAQYLKSIAQSVEVMTHSLMKSATHTSLNNQISQLSFLADSRHIRSGEQALACMRTINLLEELVATNNSLQSVYLYLESSPYIFASDIGAIESSQFSDLEWLSIYENRQEPNAALWLPTRFAPSNNYPFSKRGEWVVSLLYPLASYTSNLRGALVFNVREEAFSSLFTAFDVYADSHISILSSDGQTVSALDKRQISRPADEELISTVLSAEKDTGYFIRKTENGDSMLVSYHRSSFQGWSYIGERSMHSLLQKTRMLNIQLIGFHFLFAFIALLVSYYLAIRFSSPLSRLISDIQKRAGTNIQDNEIALLTRTFDSLLSEEARLENLLKERQTDRLDRALCDRLMGRHTEEDCGISGFCYIAALRIDNAKAFAQQYTPEQQFYIRNMLTTLCVQSALPEMKAVSVLLDHEQMAVIFPQAQDPERIKTCLSRFQGTAASTLDLSLTVGLSVLHTAPEGLAEGLREAMEASKMRLLCGYGGLFSYLPASAEKYYYPFHLEKKILSCLQMGDREGTRAALSAFMKDVGSRPCLSADSALQIINQFTGSLLRYISDQHYNINRLIPAGGGENIFLQIDSAETLEEMDDILFPVMEQLIQLQTQEVEEDGDYAERMLAYIRQNYHKDFGIEEMADSIGLSYSHTRRLFKAEFGKTIVEYVNQFRIDEAKKLLQDESIGIGEIAVEVGYNNDQSFYRFFKKYVGVAPGEYRKKLSLHMTTKESPADP